MIRPMTRAVRFTGDLADLPTHKFGPSSLTWWGIIQWRDGGARRWLVLAAGAVAWCVITRPLTGVALGLVAVVVVVRHCRSTGAWRDLVPAVATAGLVLAVMPLWSWRTTGDARSTTCCRLGACPARPPGAGPRADTE